MAFSAFHTFYATNYFSSPYPEWIFLLAPRIWEPRDQSQPWSLCWGWAPSSFIYDVYDFEWVTNGVGTSSYGI